jgi:hypothetical protein
MTPDALAAAVAGPIEQMRTMLGPDGYDLQWEPAGDDRITLEIVAKPEACADCLVPKPVMLGIANTMLGEVGVAADDVVYPADGSH